MPRYYFDTDDGTYQGNGDCCELAGPEEVRTAVLASLPDMARDTIPDGDHRVMQVTATDDSGRVVYSATLTLEGRWGKKV